MRDRFLGLCIAIRGLLIDDEGQDLVEYALLLTLITCSLIAALNSIASTLVTFYSNVSSSLA